MEFMILAALAAIGSGLGDILLPNFIGRRTINSAKKSVQALRMECILLNTGDKEVQLDFEIARCLLKYENQIPDITPKVSNKPPSKVILYGSGDVEELVSQLKPIMKTLCEAYGLSHKEARNYIADYFLDMKTTSTDGSIKNIYYSESNVRTGKPEDSVKNVVHLGLASYEPTVGEKPKEVSPSSMSAFVKIQIDSLAKQNFDSDSKEDVPVLSMAAEITSPRAADNDTEFMDRLLDFFLESVEVTLPKRVVIPNNKAYTNSTIKAFSEIIQSSKDTLPTDVAKDYEELKFWSNHQGILLPPMKSMTIIREERKSILKAEDLSHLEQLIYSRNSLSDKQNRYEYTLASSPSSILNIKVDEKGLVDHGTMHFLPINDSVTHYFAPIFSAAIDTSTLVLKKFSDYTEYIKTHLSKLNTVKPAAKAWIGVFNSLPPIITTLLMSKFSIARESLDTISSNYITKLKEKFDSSEDEALDFVMSSKKSDVFAKKEENVPQGTRLPAEEWNKLTKAQKKEHLSKKKKEEAKPQSTTKGKNPPSPKPEKASIKEIVKQVLLETSVPKTPRRGELSPRAPSTLKGSDAVTGKYKDLFGTLELSAIYPILNKILPKKDTTERYNFAQLGNFLRKSSKGNIVLTTDKPISEIRSLCIFSPKPVSK